MSNWLQDEALLATFKTEVGERLTSLQQGLLTLESSPNSVEVMDAIFRDAHTIKGSAKMMGFDGVKEIAHRMEDLLGDVKDGKVELTSPVADLLLKASDDIRNLLESGEAAPPRQLLAALEEARKGRSAPRNEPQASSSRTEESAARQKATSASIEGPARLASRASRSDESQVRKREEVPEEFREAAPDSALEVLAAEADRPSGEAAGRSEAFVNPIGQSIRIEATKLYELIDQVGEVVIGEVRLEEVSRALNEQVRAIEARLRRMRHRESGQELVGLLEEVRERVGILTSQLVETVLGQGRGLDRLQEQAMRLAMLPTASIFAPFPRLVRNLCRELGKEVDLQLDGGGTELDKQVLEQIVDPIRHLLINAVDHGIETPAEREAAGKSRRGSLRVSARQQGRQVVISVADDGAGIDAASVREVAAKRGLIDASDELSEQESLALLFRPGFSTARTVTDTSGRGVGLDVVKEAVDRLKGSVDVESTPGSGTTFSITLPITLAIVEVVLVSAGGQEFAIPVSSVDEVVAVPAHEVETVGGRQAVTLRDVTTALVPLHSILRLPPDEVEEGPVVVIATPARRIAFRVGELLGQQEVVIKGLGSFLGRVRHVAGASILGDGRVVLVLDPHELIETARRPSHEASPISRRALTSDSESAQARILIVDDSLAIREMLRSIFEAAGYRVETAVDGQDAIVRMQKGRFDGVVTDIEMPRMDGFDLVSTIRSRQETQSLPVVMVTSLAREDDRRRGLEVGANAYIVKSSFDQTRLLETVRTLVGR